MNPRILLTLAAAALLLGSRALALLPIPSDGSDGNFNPGANIEVDLSQAVTGAWDANNAANAGLGRYDASKWAVVFKYASVNIPVGVTVTFKNHPTHAPVVWLVSGNVTIAGTVKLDGANGTYDAILRLAPPESGPGGFRGGAVGPTGFGTGFGPGGANFGGHGTYNLTYGNPQILPLIGGSGAGSTQYNENKSGSGGGGAILIAAAGTIQLTGSLSANGGPQPPETSGNGATFGSGGAIRLVSEQVTGNGNVSAISATSSSGRVRIETSLLSTNLVINPNTVAVPPPATPVIWPAANAPTTRILSVDGVGAPADPSSPLLSSADVGVQNNGNVDVLIQTTNFPISGNVKLRVGPKYASSSLVNAVYVSGTFTTATWRATLTFNPGFSALQAIATVP